MLCLGTAEKDFLLPTSLRPFRALFGCPREYCIYLIILFLCRAKYGSLLIICSAIIYVSMVSIRRAMHGTIVTIRRAMHDTIVTTHCKLPW